MESLAATTNVLSSGRGLAPLEEVSELFPAAQQVYVSARGNTRY
jgi:hypothetical protein